ncbi:hypothetical protein [Oleiharenicola lentus]|uniref:hypothetical protein n=1 Tax=Oleiharenicola lentus TaxID=2508720 RepID=UPI003F681D6A
MKSLRRLALALVGFLASLAALAQTAPTSLRVLFLGNSLTDGNDVPALVQGMAQLQGVELKYTTIAPGGYAIEDHWRDGNQIHLAQGNYDIVVLQQGPSTLVESQANLRQWATTWANEARKYGTLPALYMIWPVRTQTNGFALVAQSYRNAALAADASIFPAGEAWDQVTRANPAIALYSEDNLHATSTGSFLAAMVIARGMVGLDPERVPTRVGLVSVPTATLTVFRNVVAGLPATVLPAKAAATTPATPTITSPTTTLTPQSSGNSNGSGGGGGPSAWWVVALLTIGALRFRHALLR